jgi:hypothetical protein
MIVSVILELEFIVSGFFVCYLLLVFYLYL